MLTPQDVLNTTFTPTQLREGYDEREVDDFLDDVVASMRHLDDPGRGRPRRLLTTSDVIRSRFGAGLLRLLRGDPRS